MGSLLSGVSFKEPTTVEDCDSTWETDSEPELQELAGGGEGKEPPEGLGVGVGGGEKEDRAGGGGDDWDSAEDEQQQRRQQGEPLPAANYSPEDVEQQQQQQEEEEGAAEEDEEEEEEDEVGEEAEGAQQEAGGLEEAEAASTEQGDEEIEVTAKPKRSFYAARDLYKYRHQYPNFKDLRYQNDLCNLRFYKNKIPFKPDGVYIEEVLNKWKGDYEKLEHNHTYIQWLFPLREQGLNFYAKELTTYEIEEFKKTKEAIRRFLLAYKMMLEFFGIKLIDKTGNVTRASNWQERFQHLNESQHNYLRITRILKSLGELGYESFKPPLVKFILHEALVEDTIPNIKQSALEYFVYTIRDRRERRKLLRFAQQHYTPSDHFIWGPPRKQKLEGSKPSKKLGSPISLHSSCASKHKRARDTKNIPTVCSSSGRGTEEKRAEEIKSNEDCDQSKKQGSSEVTQHNKDVKSTDAEGQSPKVEETANLLNQKEGISHFKKHKGKNDESLSEDCRNLETVEKDSGDSGQDTSKISANPQGSVDNDKNSVGLNIKNQKEALA